MPSQTGLAPGAESRNASRAPSRDSHRASLKATLKPPPLKPLSPVQTCLPALMLPWTAKRIPPIALSRRAGEGINLSCHALFAAEGSKPARPARSGPSMPSRANNISPRLKCDRQHPCKTCIDRGLSLSCTYTQHVPGPGKESRAPHNVHDRIDQLEKLVTALMSEKAQSSKCAPIGSPSNLWQGPSDSTNSTVPDTPSRVKLDDDSTSYSNSAHWSSILDGITELKDELDQIPGTAQPRDPTQKELPGPDILFGRQRHSSQAEIVAGVPPRAEADLLVNLYFDSMDMAPAILHRPTFFREYEQFWERPFDTPVMWLGILFCIFAISIRFQAVLENPDDASGHPHSSLFTARMDSFREKAVQCLVLANYSKCPPYTVEAFLHYFVTEYFRSQDGQFGIWVLTGILVRIAFRMGYHREPSRFSNISPFKAEMRRRLWVMILQLDLMSSSQVGLPRMIMPSVYDTQEPRNLIDEDLCENMTELPPSRPDTESTVMLYTQVRNKVLHVFSRITDLANMPAAPAYRDIMELDTALRAVYDNMPPSMKGIRSKDFDYADSAVSMRKLYLGLSFLKAELTLHRPYLLLGRTDTRYEYSRLACLDAAMEILEFQKRLFSESQEGGRLWSKKWRLWAVSWRLSSLVTHDFLLATTVLSLDLDKDIISPLPVPEENFTNRVRFKSGQPTRTEIVEALTSAYEIWVRQSERSREAKKVATAVRVVLGKANAPIEYDNGSGEYTLP